MAEQLPDSPDEKHPVAAGLAAILGVGLVLGVILGLVVVVGTKVAGLGGSDTAASSSRATMYLPTPEKTTASGGPQITLAPGGGNASSSSSKPSKPSKSASKKPEITLSASAVQAGPMERFQLTGVYPLGEGAILTVQRFENGGWQDFPATGSVSGTTFQIPIETSRSGENRFRVVDTATGLKSKPVKVTVTGG